MDSKNGMYKCHYVSKVLLKQFSKNGIISVYNKESKSWSHKKTNEVGFLYLPVQFFKSIEQEWNKLETQVGNIFLKYGNTPELYLKDNRALAVLKKFLSLHFTRSVVFFDLLPKCAMQEEEKLLTSVPVPHREEVKVTWRRSVATEAASIIKSTYLKIKNHMSGYTFELGTSNDKKFILGDVPIVNFNFDEKMGRNIGINNGVGFTSSEVFLMPISPYHLLSLHKRQKEFLFSAKDVYKTNQMTKEIIETEFYCLPG